MHRRLRTALAAATAAALSGGLLAVAAGSGAGAAEPPGPVVDFNGDGVRDVAVSAPQAYVAGVRGASLIVAHYGAENDGTAAGLSGSRAKRLSQHSAGVPGTAEDGDGWGGWTAAADLDGDGYTDLAVAALLLADRGGDGYDDLTVGAAGENGGNGAVYALRSDAGGVAADGAVALHPSTVGMPTTGAPGYGAEFAG
jgi:hypothetical protein